MYRPPREIPEEGDLAAVPDLAVEVISTGDLYKDVTGKLTDYFQLGVRQVGTVDPSQKQIWVHDSPNHARILGLDDTLEAPDLLPGFSMPIAPLFKRTFG